MEEGNSLLKSSIKLRESPQTAQEITLSCLAGRELINAIRKQVQEALEKCKQDLGLCVMVMFVVDLLTRKEGRIILPFKTGRSSESRKAQQ